MGTCQQPCRTLSGIGAIVGGVLNSAIQVGSSTANFSPLPLPLGTYPPVRVELARR